MAADMTKEAVNHPSHYGGDTIYETIKVMEAKLSHDEFVGAMKFQIARYFDRGGKKSPEALLEDWRKGAWYANYLVDYEARHRAGNVGEARARALVTASAAETFKFKTEELGEPVLAAQAWRPR